MTGTQIVLPTTFSGSGVEGLPFILHGLPGPAPAHRYLPYTLTTALGANVGALPDLNGGITLARGLVDQQPTLENSSSGLPPHLLFSITPAKKLLQGSKAAPAAITMAVVFEFTTNPSAQYVARYGGKNIAINGGGNVLVGDSLTSSAPAIGTARKVVIARFSAADTKVWVNGAVTAGAGSAPSAADPTVLWGMNANTAAFRGYEFALWDQALTDAQATALNTALMTEWQVA
ncbi:hypothetical protein NNX28_17080 [Arthrobacter sp. zg-Y859]|uniref:LamG domain-containing protein n=1 Tax=Arthrobacter jinronghuae TaxID=2964609 RepID=A0ABT1NV73_9MICC|nr:hypothetical protein [Arthrobacter jinronghuae]MCQ1951634.1 hypothetical protein [Arthrobacter jinronghuae]UWX79652.1 hypothetical protein N2K98_05500 [Arthrobacter jinronghuae]